MVSRKVMKIKDVIWEDPACDYCASKEKEIFLENIHTWEYEGNFRIVRCVNCGLMFTSPRPIPTMIGKFYSKEGYWGRNLCEKQTQDKSYLLERKKLFDQIYCYSTKDNKKKKVYDVGAGTGLFLTYYKEKGWTANGCEISKEAVTYAKNAYGIKLTQGDFNIVNIKNNSYDIVTFNSSLEHIYHPVSAIQKAYKILKNNGYVVITVPNIESLGFNIFKERWLPLHPPKHLYHFSHSILSKMLSKNGFAVVKTTHCNFTHGYYSIFNSIRYAHSPKYANKIIDNNNNSNKQKAKISVKNMITVNVARIVSVLITFFGCIIERGETITIYARKD